MRPWDLQEMLFYLRLPIETFSLCLCRSRQCDRRLHRRRHTSLPPRSEYPGVEPAGPWQNQHHTGCVCMWGRWECEGVNECEHEVVRVWMRERRYTLATLCHFYANGGWHHPPQTFSGRQHGSTNTNYSDNYRNTIYYTQSATTYNNLWVMWFSNEFYYIITNDVRMMFWRTYLLIQDTCPVIIHLDRELWWNTLHHSHKFVCPHSISTVNLNTCSWERRWLRVVGREKGRRRERGGEVEEERWKEILSLKA